MSDLCTCENQLQPHDRMVVCPQPCDDCYRTDGAHDPEVEH